VALYDALRECCCHPTAEELYHMARTRVTRLSLATVYNTLEALHAAGLARKLPTENGCSRYDADTSDHLHVQMSNARLQDVPMELSQRLLDRLPQDVIDEIGRHVGVEIAGVSLTLIAKADRDGADVD
jgi:Fe2+ or Zn2+ uptake regulation protein